MTLPYGWIDVLSDGRHAIAIWQQPFFQFGADPQIPLTEYLMFARARLLFGQGWAVGKGNRTGAAWVVREDGNTINLGGTYANYPVLIGQMGSDVAVVAQTGFTVYHTYVIDPVTLAVTDLGPTTITGSSQGFLDFDPSQLGLVPLPTDPTDRVINGYGCFYPTAVKGGVQLAQAGGELPSQALGIYGAQTGTINLGTCYEPHLDPTGRWGCCRGDSTVSVFPIPATCPPLVTNPPEPVLPTFAPSTVCRWFMVAGRSPSPEDPANIYRLTTLSETPAQQADPRNRGVYLEKTEDIHAAVALCQKYGFARIARNYDGLNDATFPLATSLWNADDDAIADTPILLLPCGEFYPGTQVIAPFAEWCQSEGFLCAAWLAYYCGVTIPPAQAWTLQQALDSQGAAWAALVGLCEFVLLFCYEVMENGAIVDGVQAFPAFQESRDNLVKAIQGADIKPVPPHPSTAHPLALSLISKGAL